jgi:hypothetical protein
MEEQISKIHLLGLNTSSRTSRDAACVKGHSDMSSMVLAHLKKEVKGCLC